MIFFNYVQNTTLILKKEYRKKRNIPRINKTPLKKNVPVKYYKNPLWSSSLKFEHKNATAMKILFVGYIFLIMVRSWMWTIF